MLFLGLRKDVDQKIPTTFVCPLSFVIMSNPVADPDDSEGRAAERLAVEEFQRRYGFRPFSGLPPTVNHLPLAKLQSTIAEFLREDGILRQIEHRPYKRLCGGADTNELGPLPGVAAHLSEQSSTQQFALDFLAQEVPVTFFCPLSWRIMRDPVIDIRNVSDVSWDRRAMENHLAEHNTNPKTGGLLTPSDLRPDRNLKGAIALWLRKNTKPYPPPARATAIPRGEPAASAEPAVGTGRLPGPTAAIPGVPDPAGGREQRESATIGNTTAPDATRDGVAMATAAMAAAQGIPAGMAASPRSEQQRLVVTGGNRSQQLEEPVHGGRWCIAALGVTMADAVVARATCGHHPATTSAAIDSCDTTMYMHVISGAPFSGSNAVVVDTARAAMGRADWGTAGRSGTRRTGGVPNEKANSGVHPVRAVVRDTMAGSAVAPLVPELWVPPVAEDPTILVTCPSPDADGVVVVDCDPSPVFQDGEASTRRPSKPPSGHRVDRDKREAVELGGPIDCGGARQALRPLSSGEPQRQTPPASARRPHSLAARIAYELESLVIPRSQLARRGSLMNRLPARRGEMPVYSHNAVQGCLAPDRSAEESDGMASSDDDGVTHADNSVRDTRVTVSDGWTGAGTSAARQTSGVDKGSNAGAASTISASAIGGDEAACGTMGDAAGLSRSITATVDGEATASGGGAAARNQRLVEPVQCKMIGAEDVTFIAGADALTAPETALLDPGLHPQRGSAGAADCEALQGSTWKPVQDQDRGLLPPLPEALEQQQAKQQLQQRRGQQHELAMLLQPPPGVHLELSYQEDCQANTQRQQWELNPAGLQPRGHKMSGPKLEELRLAEQQPAKQQPVEPQLAEVQPAEMQPAETQPADLHMGHNQPVEPQLAELLPAEVQPAEVQPAEMQPAAMQPAETQPADLHMGHNQPVEPLPAEMQPTEMQPAEVQPVETQPADLHMGHNQPVEAQPAEVQPAEVQPAEPKPADLHMGHNQPVEAQLAELLPAEVQPAEVQPAETQPADLHMGHNQPVEPLPAEMLPAEMQPAEVQPVETQPADLHMGHNQPVELLPVEAQPAEVQPAEVQPAEPKPADLHMGHNQPVEAQPAEVQPAEVQPAEVQPAEVQPADLHMGHNQPVEAQPAEVQPAEVQPAEPKPADLHMGHNQPVEAQLAELLPAEVQPAEVQPAEIQPAEPKPAEQTQKQPVHHPTESIDTKLRTAQRFPASRGPRMKRVVQGWRPSLAPAELGVLLSIASTVPSSGVAPAAAVGGGGERPPNQLLWPATGPVVPTTSSHNPATTAPLEAFSGGPPPLPPPLTTQTGLTLGGTDGAAAGVGPTGGMATELGQQLRKVAADEPSSGPPNTFEGGAPSGRDLTRAASAGGPSSSPAGALPMAALTTETASVPSQSPAHRSSARSGKAKVVYATTWAELLAALKEAAATSSAYTKMTPGASPDGKRKIAGNGEIPALVCEADGAADAATVNAGVVNPAAASAVIGAVAVGGLEPSIVIDLRGAVLVAPRGASVGACPSNVLRRQPQSRLPPFRITTEGVMIRNGTLQLPRGQRVLVCARGVQLVELTICGPGIQAAPEEEVGLLEILGSNTSASLEHCRVSMQQRRGGVTAASTSAGAHVGGIANGGPEPCCAAVLVGRGASAHLQNCTITGAGRDGLVAWGPGSWVSAGVCIVRDCGASGFAAIDGGCMGPLLRCEARSNKLYGFCAEDPCSLLRVGLGCTSQGNEVGFGSTHGGTTVVAAGCLAEGNTDAGFNAIKAGSKLTAHDGCIARGCGIGFAAGEGSELFVGAGCVAEGMAGHSGGDQNKEDDPFDGFLATGQRSRVTVGAGCRAEGNRQGAGFAARYGGAMQLGPDCVSRQNGRFGFAAEGPRAQLKVGERCVADQNSMAGFVAAFGGSLTAAGGCVAIKNDNAGFMATRDNSRLTTGSGCVAERCTGDGASGFVAQCGGLVEVGRNCVSRDNAADGYVSHGRGSSMFAGADCKSSKNGSTGYLAAKGGKLTLASGCISIGNVGEGFCALGGSIMVGAGCRAEDNNLDGFTACRPTESQNASRGAGGTRGRGSGSGARGDGQVGVLDASAGNCSARGNGGSGFCCEDSGCRLLAGQGCTATGNRGAGFYVKDGGEISAGKGCTAAGNMGWGFIAVGKRTLLRLWPGCQEAAADGGNGSGPSRAQGGAVIATLPV